nr:MAG TPA: hypothetical protein [Caudoviricetes sp.]DAN34469.1 MAG TPA: hypothetical protein [Caudoviricetes sp.]DAO02076.1 MAG TPA: hypothetical protein [Caudoviricetes sp.]DAP06849.1 MAG TPA: hypothetical protein [Caudoviricetes sp.]DAQ74904.1 MAG TPA: hypothetical protein [Caudoviricetes sp.]
MFSIFSSSFMCVSQYSFPVFPRCLLVVLRLRAI